MSIRRRNVQNRVTSDLNRERTAHEVTKGFLKLHQDLAKRAVDANTEALQKIMNLQHIVTELGRYFSTEPPQPLSRESVLFVQMMQHAPQSIPKLPTPPTTLQDILQVLEDVVGLKSIPLDVTIEDFLKGSRT